MPVEQSVVDEDHFGRELRRLRERAGLMQVQLATRLGYSHTYLSKLESGVRVPRIAFAGQADGLLNAGGALLALATSARARRHSDGVPAAGQLGIPLPCPPSSAGSAQSPPVRRIDLPAFGVLCPLHGAEGCSVPSPAGLPEVLDADARTPTAGAETLHGFAALLTTYIRTDIEALTDDLTVPVEQVLRALMELAPKARGAVSVGLLQLASQYADLAGWLRVKRGQHGIGMAWLQRGVEWGLASRNLAAACGTLSRMTILAWLEGDATTALEYSRASAEVDGSRRWTIVQSKLHQARCHAMLGDWHEFARQSSEAQRTAGRLGDRDRMEAPWLFDAEGETLIASSLAGALRDLAEVTGDRAVAGRAVNFAETSLANVPARLRASRLLLTLRLADSHACTGDIDAAIAVARPVFPAAASAPSTLVRQEFDRLRIRLGDRSGELGDPS